MKTIKISQLEKEPIVNFSNKDIALSNEIQKKVDTYWQSLMDGGRQYTRGEVFTVTKVEDRVDDINVLVEKTDYAHYLYCQNVDANLDGYGIKIIFTACLVETSDNKTIFGQMGEHTARSGIYQLAGGGIDNSDLKDNVFDLNASIAKELKEELNIEVEDDNRINNFSIAYLKQGGQTHKIAVVYRVTLNETAKEFLEKYNIFTQKLKSKKENPEFGKLILLDQSIDAINSFFETGRKQSDEYMEPLFKYVYQ